MWKMIYGVLVLVATLTGCTAASSSVAPSTVALAKPCSDLHRFVEDTVGDDTARNHEKADIDQALIDAAGTTLYSDVAVMANIQDLVAGGGIPDNLKDTDTMRRDAEAQCRTAGHWTTIPGDN